ncbi:hypothetical protein GBAR_LOCUS20498, partial [Geodia barretti]
MTSVMAVYLSLPRSRDSHVQSSPTSGGTPHSECRCFRLHLNSCSYLS